jgi:DNA-binding response OmpR family regulator
MIVDDEPDITNTFKAGLERAGFTIDAFTDPQAALDHFKPDYYDLVITDIKMPRLNGFELYRELKKKDHKIKVAFITAFEMYASEFRKVMPEIDVECFIRKPIQISDLVARVREELSEDEVTMQ